MKKYVVLGAGRQGTAAAYDLALNGNAENIHLLDVDSRTVNNSRDLINSLTCGEKVTGSTLDVNDLSALTQSLENADGLLAAVPYKYLPSITDVAISTRTHMVDLGGHTDNARKQLERTEEARKVGVTIVPDCGMGPGMNITMALLAMEQMESPLHVSIWDGGLPADPEPPWNYALFFNINGLTNEYYGNAYFLENGKLTEVPCFERYELLDFPKPLGQLEAAVTSGGLSTMPWTFEGKLLTLENKTLRYPGHWEWMKAYQQLGLFEETPVDFKGQKIIPREFYHRLLEPQLNRGRVNDVCIMRVRCTGNTDGKPVVSQVDALEYTDDETGFTAMEKWTGWHASIMLIRAVKGQLEKGAIPVEKALSGSDFLAEAQRRGYQIRVSVKGDND